MRNTPKLGLLVLLVICCNSNGFGFWKILHLIKPLTLLKPKPAYSGCELRFSKLGCYKDSQVSPRPLEHYALNARDRSHPTYLGIHIDWKNWENFLRNFTCRCAEAAKSLGHKYFGIQFFEVGDIVWFSANAEPATSELKKSGDLWIL